jgi:hypothetical protein
VIVEIDFVRGAHKKEKSSIQHASATPTLIAEAGLLYILFHPKSNLVIGNF